MRRRTGSISLALVIIAVTWLALQDSSAASDGPTAQVIAGTDDILADIAATVPGFAGISLDAEGNLNLHLQDTARSAQAQAAIANVLGADRFGSANVRVVEAKYGFIELHTWRLKMRQSVLGIPGVTSLDIDEPKNRLRVGLQEAQIQQPVVAELAALGIPRDAVILEVEEAVIPTATLRDWIRPVVGGLQITRSDSIACTLGFNASRSGINGFVTNSHCTTVQGQVEGTIFYQQGAGNWDRIGAETVDGPFWTGAPCPPLRSCRWSDSAFARYDSGESYTRGIVARTALGSVTIVGQYRVTGEVSLPVNGETLNKVGIATGRTQGVVAATCYDQNVPGGTKTLLCQNRVSGAGMSTGDSGAPVFRVTNSPNANDVSLYGVAWAAVTGGGFVFSSMYTIQVLGEVGSLTNCASGFSC